MGGGKASKVNATVVGVLLVIAFIYVVVVFRVIIPWFENSVPGVLNLAIITVNSLLSAICYVQCVFTDAGRVPAGWKPDEESNSVVMEVKKKGGGARFCQKCQLPKPPRCHHCRVCKRCVLRMDHHCPWVNNCIGHGNYKAFFLFLIYVTAAAIHAMGLQCMYGLNQLQANRDRRARGGFINKPSGFNGDHTAAAWALAQTLCFTVTFPLTLGLVMLLGWHIYLVINNKTTIEYHEGVTAKIQAAKVGRQWKHPYDLGLCGNLHGVLGSSAALWLLPVPRSAHGDGLSYTSGIEPL